MLIELTTQLRSFHIYTHGYLTIYTVMNFIKGILGFSSGENHNVAKILDNINMDRD